ISIRPAVLGVTTQRMEKPEQNRAWVRERVGYPPPAMAVPNLFGTKMGVIENLDSLTPHQPTFRHALDQQGGQRSRPWCEVESQGSDLDEGRLKDCHHATFITGLLVGQDEPARGLMPGVDVKLIDAKDFPTLTSAVSAAISAGYKIFNFSQTLPLRNANSY